MTTRACQESIHENEIVRSSFFWCLLETKGSSFQSSIRFDNKQTSRSFWSTSNLFDVRCAVLLACVLHRTSASPLYIHPAFVVLFSVMSLQCTQQQQENPRPPFQNCFGSDARSRAIIQISIHM